MADNNRSYTSLDSNQIFQRAFDEESDRIKVDTQITANIGAVECIITAASGDNIQLSDGTTNVGVTVGGELRVSDSGIASLNAKFVDNYGSSTLAIRTASQIGNTTGQADFNTGATGAQTLRTTSNVNDGLGNAITSTTVVADLQTHRALDVNVLGDLSFTLSPIPTSNIKTVIKYNELTMVASGSLETLLSYTVPPATTSLLQRIFVSGENIAIYKVIHNSNTIATKRTYYTYLNEQFDFVQHSNNGFVLETGDTIEISVLQNRTTAADFESTLQIIEVS